jgi:hypothetical protein
MKRGPEEKVSLWAELEKTLDMQMHLINSR